MTTTMTVFKIGVDFSPEGSHTIYRQVGETIENSDVIEAVIDKCNNNWHLEGVCGYIGELTGVEFLDVVNIPDHTQEIDEDSAYRVEVCW